MYSAAPVNSPAQNVATNAIAGIMPTILAGAEINVYGTSGKLIAES
jgi:hypothetical protein